MPGPPDPLVRPSPWKVLGFQQPPDPAELAAAAQRTGPPSTPAPQDEDWMSRTARMVGGGVLQLGDLVRGLTIGTDDPNDTWAAKGGTLAAAGLPVIEGLKGAAIGLPALGRFFSRVDRVAEAIPKKGIHPNKLKSLLQSGASQEEVAYRKVDQLLANKGNALVTPEELKAHLAANPAPFPEKTVLGAPTPIQRPPFEEWVGAAHVDPGGLEPEVEAALRELHARPAFDPAKPTKYHSYTLPGGEDYREHLLQLPTPKAKQGRYRVEIHEPHPSGVGTSLRHVDENVSGTDVERLRQTYQGAPNGPYDVRFEEIPTPVDPASAFRSGHFDQPNILAHARTKERALPSGERGRFIEEIQSDWHQQGKKQGYQQLPTPEAAARLAQLPDEIDTARRTVADFNHQLTGHRNAYLDRLRQSTIPHLPPEFAHLTTFDASTREGPQAVAAWRAARERAMQSGGAPSPLQQLRDAETVTERQLQTAVDRVTELQAEQNVLSKPRGIPDAPFKESWPDLALKQQLLDTAHHPDLSWLGFTRGQTQAERYDLSKQISKLTFEPHDGHDFSAGTLVAHDLHGDEVLREHGLEPHQLDEYIGKEPADALRRKIDEHAQARDYERSQWSVEKDPDIPNRFYIHDPNGEPLYQHGGTLERYESPEEAHDRIDELLRDAQMNYGRESPSLEGLDLQVGGEGMQSFYDQLLPKRLQKILKPFGGTVERAQINTLPTGAIPQGNPSLEETSAWIARLTPEMKARILREGLPLLAIPAAAGLAYGQPGYQGDVNAPPVPPPAPRR